MIEISLRVDEKYVSGYSLYSAPRIGELIELKDEIEGIEGTFRVVNVSHRIVRLTDEEYHYLIVEALSESQKKRESKR